MRFMFKRFTRQQLHELVWEKPMTKLAAEFGLSDVALHKICRKHRIPTPPAGYWAKKAYGKRVMETPFPDPSDATEIVIREGAGADEPAAIAEARAAVSAALRDAAKPSLPNSIVERTLAKLGSAKRGRDGLVRVDALGLIAVAVRLESVERAGAVLTKFVAAGEQAGCTLTKSSEAAAWFCDGETIAFELVEVADQVEHVASEKELAAVAKWQRERDEDHKRYGYWRDWGEPKIPKWEHRYQGRLAIKLEEVRVQSERSWWGAAVRRTFSDTRTRDVSKMIPRAVATIAAIAAAKKHNRDMEARRRAAEQDAARQRAQAERRRLLNQRAGELVDTLAAESAAADRLRSVLRLVPARHTIHPLTGAFIDWMEQRLQAMETQLGAEALEQRLAEAELFGGDQTDDAERSR